jgi:predicted nucleic acid-binding protein
VVQAALARPGANHFLHDPGRAGRWAISHNWGQKRRDELERFLAGYHVHYADRLVCRLWAEITVRAERRGRKIKVADAWIAATALALDVNLLTHNSRDFAGVEGLTVISAPPSE